MATPDIVEQVYRSGDFPSTEQAETVTRSTLRALGTCLTPGQARDVAEPLPRPLSEEIVDVDRETPEPMAYEEFLETVREEADLADDGHRVERDVRSVVAVLAGRIGEAELDNIRAQLPPNYDRLFDVEPATVGRPFVDLVVERGSFDPDVDATAVTRAILETLGERLSRGEAADLARYLAGDAKQLVVDQESADAASFSADEFVARVSMETDATEEAVREGIEVVGDVLVDVVPSRELERMFAQLPAEYDPLFGVE